jgi:hypothetical protein
MATVAGKEVVFSVGHQIPKIQVLPRYLPGFSLAGTYLSDSLFQVPT